MMLQLYSISSDGQSFLPPLSQCLYPVQARVQHVAEDLLRHFTHDVLLNMNCVGVGVIDAFERRA